VVEVGGKRLLGHRQSDSDLEKLFLGQSIPFFQRLRFEVIGVGCDLHDTTSKAIQEFREWCDFRQAAAALQAPRTDAWIDRFRNLLNPGRGQPRLLCAGTSAGCLFQAGEPLFVFNRAVLCLRYIRDIVSDASQLGAMVQAQLTACDPKCETNPKLEEILKHKQSRQWLQGHFSFLAGYFVVPIVKRKPPLPVPLVSESQILAYLDDKSKGALDQVSRHSYQRQSEVSRGVDNELDRKALGLAQEYMLQGFPQGPWRKRVFDTVPVNDGTAWIKAEVKPGVAIVVLEKRSGNGVTATILKAELAFWCDAEPHYPILANEQIQRWVGVRLANFACTGAYRLLQGLSSETLDYLTAGDPVQTTDIYWDYFPCRTGNKNGISRLFVPPNCQPPVNMIRQVP